ncbi:hypothetical protein FGG08_006902 [Glutinoglossum americanum]|uniref:Large ribosomal subunit protein mL50 n=1 Tax=Glutinoglossum americanum TaxID=1670608 RepID=A0A9P8KWZ4_9PEZI|nr:hypothetical protein FGG08_006902 [Glutinoglossum americanum]
MRRLSRLGRSIGIVHDSAIPLAISPRFCSACRSRRLLPLAAATNFSTFSSRPARRQPTTDPENTPFSEKLRRKLWGTDKPPGQIDPYNPHDRRTRPVEEEVSVVTGGAEAYSPATTWDGLEHVGGSGGWWEKNWDPVYGFKASMCFIPPERLASPTALTNALHRAVVEVFTLQQAGKPLGDVSNIPTNLDEDITTPVQITLNEQQGISLVYPDGQVKEDILQYAIPSELPQEVIEAATDETSEDKNIPTDLPTEGEPPTTEKEGLLVAGEQSSGEHYKTDSHLQEIISTWNPSWLSIPLTEPALKFAILKRTTQLTGHLIPDPKIHNLLTTQSLLTLLVTPPPPRKLAQSLLENEELVRLPNVKVVERRVTPVDREKAVGRWKIIEKELEERGLPVLGRG